MKLTKKILIGMLLLLVCSIIFSAFKFKQEYDKNDKGELYFLYATIHEQPFSHLVIRGGNVSKIIYEPAAKSSVRVFRRWNGFKEKRIKSTIRHDTLYLDFPGQYKDIYEKMQLKNTAIVRLFSPALKSVIGSNTNLKLTKLKQKDLVVDISGNSTFVAESLVYDFNTLSVKASDTTDITFEISSDLKKSRTTGSDADPHALPSDVKGWDAFHIKNFHAVVSGKSFINIGHAQVDSIDFRLSDTAAIVLSGGTIRKNHLEKK